MQTRETFYELMPTPIAVNWNFTYLCNLNCLHCYSRSLLRPELSTVQAKLAAQKLFEVGVEYITFGGGESLLRPDFYEVATFCAQIGFGLRLITNGTSFSSDTAKLLRDIGVEKVLISLDGPTSEVHERVRGRGTFAKAVDTIQQCKEENLPVMVLTTFGRVNLNMVRSFIVFLNNLSIQEWRVNEIKEMGNAAKNRSNVLLPTEVRQLHAQLHRLNKEYQGTIIFDSKFSEVLDEFSVPSVQPGCHCAKLTFALRANGDISPCVYLPLKIGNILENDFTRLWAESALVRSIRYKQPRAKCLKCRWFDQCQGGCFARSYHAKGDLEQPDPLCWVGNCELSLE